MVMVEVGLGERGLAEGTVRVHVDVARPGIAAACVVTSSIWPG